MRIYLVRHGQSEWQLRPSDDLDTQLTATGHQQAALLATWLAAQPRLDAKHELRITALRTSPCRRARDTAAYMSERLGLPAPACASLREADFHVASQLPRDAGPLDLARDWKATTAYAGFRDQAQAALQEMVGAAPEPTAAVLAVSHGGLIKTMLRLLCGTLGISFKLYNTGITTLEWSEGRWHLIHLNLCDHLAAELRTR